MKLYTTAVAMFLMVSSAVAFAGNGSGPSAGNAAVTPGESAVESMGEKMFGRPDIAGDGVQNASQVDSPSDIGNQSSTALDAPEPVPTVGDAGVQNIHQMQMLYDIIVEKEGYYRTPFNMSSNLSQAG